METCAICRYWKRDGIDGICFGGVPRPQIVEKEKEYVNMWPRTNADQQACWGFKQAEDERLM